MISRARVLVLADVKFWAWDLKAHAYARHLSSDFHITIGYQTEGLPDLSPFDLIHTFEFPQAGMIPPAFRAQGRRVVTGLTAAVWRTWGKEKVLTWAARADGVHANSLLLHEDLATNVFTEPDDPPLFYVPNGVDETYWKRTRSSPDKLIVGHVGKPNPRKGAEIIINACRRLAIECRVIQRTAKLALSQAEMLDWYQGVSLQATASNSDGTPNPCVPLGTTIETSRGPIAVEDVVVGDLLLTHRGRYRKVTEVFRRPYNGPLKVLDATGFASSLRVTPNHPVLAIPAMHCDLKGRGHVICKSSCRAGEKLRYCGTLHLKYSQDFIKAEALRSPVLLVSPRELEMPLEPPSAFYLASYIHGEGPRSRLRVDGDKVYFLCGNDGRRNRQRVEVPNRIDVDGDLMRLFGYYLAEGSLSRGYQLRFALHEREVDFAEDIKSTMRRKFHLEPCQEYQTGHGISINYGSKAVGRLFVELLGKGSLTKWIRPELYFQSDEFIWQLLVGYIRGDGHLALKVSRLSVGTASPMLATQLFRLLLRVGVVGQQAKYSRRRGGRVYTGTTLTVSRPYFEMVVARMGLTAPRDDRKVYFKHALGSDGELLTPMKGVSEFAYDGDVINFEVEEDHSYVANGLAVHNCLESAACSNALISTPIGNMPEFVRSGVNGLLVPPYFGPPVDLPENIPCIEGFHDWLDWCKNHYPAVIEMGINARRTIEEGWTWKRQVKWVDKMWRGVLDGV